MTGLVDVLALLTTQHQQLDELLGKVANPATRAVAFSTLTELLTAHLALEQEVLYPAVGALFGRDVMTEVITEHCEIKRVLADLLWTELDDPRFAQHLTTLSALLDGHCAWQVDRMFASVEATVEVDTRLALGAQMQASLALAA